MADFVFSRQNIKPNNITKKIQSIYKEDKPQVKEFHGYWGSLGVSNNLYHGYKPYENERYIVVVIGGPILAFKNNDFLDDTGSIDGTKAIFARWEKGEMKWDNDLSGPFVVVIINKETSDVICVTDLMSFIPVYLYKNSKQALLATHVDILAEIAGQKDTLDEVSLTDFVLNGVVTYPYTVYKNIIQISPSTEHQVIRNSTKLKSHGYWIPKEKYIYNSIGNAAIELRKNLKEYINRITSQTNNIAQFISGGEDSRVISSLLKKYSRNAYIFLDHMNREGNIAEKVAGIYEAKFNLNVRSQLHYLNILPSCSDLVGGGSQYFHAHTYGFHKKCNLDTYSAVFGGLFADALIKGSHIRKVRFSGKVPFIPELKKRNYSASTPIINSAFNSQIIRDLSRRRLAHLKYIQGFRKESAEEWFELWPSSMNKNIANIHANRRLFRSFEPFTANGIIKLSASIPQKWKLNRKLFYKATKPMLTPTKWLIHSDGRFPYFPWYINGFIQFGVKIKRRLWVKMGLIKGNQGPWAQWSPMIKSSEWQSIMNEYIKEVKFKKNWIIQDRGIIQSQLNEEQQVNLLQVLYLLNKF